MRSRIASALALALTLAIPLTARADTAGPEGRAKSIEVNATSSDTYLQFHGRLFVLTGKNTTNEYRWGGVSCGSRTLPADMIQLLVDAVRAGSQVVPTYQDGQGSAKCLVGFTIKTESATINGPV